MGMIRAVPLALLLTLGGCAPADGPTTAASPATADSRAPTLHDCGTWDLGQGEPVPPQARTCLADAVRDRQPARLVVTWPTIEGDPITTSYLVRRDGRVDVTTDDRRDLFGSGRIERQTCEGPPNTNELPSFDRCSSPEPG